MNIKHNVIVTILKRLRLFIADIEKDVDISSGKYAILLVANFVKDLPNSCNREKFDNQCNILFVPHFKRSQV